MKLLPLSKIRTDGSTQPRAALDFDAIEVYAEAMRGGAKFPPLDVFYDGDSYWLADGFHRHRAAFQSDIAEFSCKIHQGTLQDAQWFSFSVNQTNGLYRSNADKQRAVKAALQHPKSKGMSNSAIAKHVGVSPVSVGTWREKLKPISKSFIDRDRTVTRGGTTYQQDISRIGKTRGKATAPAPVGAIELRPIQPLAPIPPVMGIQAHGQVLAACQRILDCPVKERDLGALVATNGGLDVLKETYEFLDSIITAAETAARTIA